MWGQRQRAKGNQWHQAAWGPAWHCHLPTGPVKTEAPKLSSAAVVPSPPAVAVPVLQTSSLPFESEHTHTVRHCFGAFGFTRFPKQITTPSSTLYITALVTCQRPQIFQAFLRHSVFTEFLLGWVVTICSPKSPWRTVSVTTGHGNRDICKQDLDTEFGFKKTEDWEGAQGVLMLKPLNVTKEPCHTDKTCKINYHNWSARTVITQDSPLGPMTGSSSAILEQTQDCWWSLGTSSRPPSGTSWKGNWDSYSESLLCRCVRFYCIYIAADCNKTNLYTNCHLTSWSWFSLSPLFFFSW